MWYRVQEQEAFAKAASLDVHKALVHIFFAQRSTKHIKGVTGVGLKARPIKKVAVIGGGLMGSGIATACILVGIQVVLKEVNQQFLDVSFRNSACSLHTFSPLFQFARLTVGCYLLGLDVGLPWFC